MPKLERLIEVIIFQSRWLLAPFYLVLVLGLVLLLGHFLREFAVFALGLPTAKGAEVILGVLNLIDIAFTANLVLIVVFSGYENFVSRIDTGDHAGPDWLSKVGFAGLKQKLMMSIVAISAIEVLKAFMNIRKYESTTLGWLVGIHVVFLLSMLVVALSDRLSGGGKPAVGKDPASARAIRS